MEFDKYGNKGNSGLTGNENGLIHVNAIYSATDNMVFVDDSDDYSPGWERVAKEDAEKDARDIITCRYCDKPAVSLDHSWPFLTGYTVCGEHHEQIKSGKLKPVD